jgi:hypothetical protein
MLFQWDWRCTSLNTKEFDPKFSNEMYVILNKMSLKPNLIFKTDHRCTFFTTIQFDSRFTAGA